MEPHDAALLDALLEDAPVGFAFYTPDLRYRRINRHLAGINRVPVDAHHGRRPSELLPDPVGQAVEEMLRRVLTTGRTYVDQDFSAEVPDRAGTGQEVRHWRSSWYPACRGNEIIGVAVLVVDISDQVRAEERLRRSRDRALRLVEATSRLGAALRVGEVADVVAELGTSTLGGSRAAMLLLADNGTLVEASAPPAQDPWSGLAPGVAPDEPAAEALRGRRPVYAADGAEAVIPLLASGVPLGLLRLTFADYREIPHDDRVFLEALAGQCAQALDRARLYELEHRTAIALQHALLPSRMPQLPELELAARYRPGAVGARVGGDWYDAFALEDGRIALVLGDMMGKGIPAAAGMARLRSAVRTLALLHPEPGRVLGLLDRVFDATEPSENIATVVLTVIDPGTGDVTAADAGHLPLLLVRGEGEGRHAELLDVAVESTPLGWPEPRSSATLHLEVGDLLVAFSDGLVESRGRSVGEGLELARRAAASAPAGPGQAGLEAFCDGLLERLAVTSGDDDVTVLVARRVS